MMRLLPIMILAMSSVALMLTVESLYAGPKTVKLPETYQSNFVKYLDVDRYDRKRVRKMYVNPEGMAAAKPGGQLPDGTILIMEDHDAKLDTDGNLLKDADGRLIAKEAVTNIFVMEKNSSWSTDNENWDYAWYGADGKPSTSKFAKTMDGCFSCHSNRAERDFNFTFSTFVTDHAN
jgi:hypothetical protein